MGHSRPVNLNLLALLQKTTNTTIYRTHFLEILYSFPKAVLCFTNGSKFKNKVGFSYSLGDRTFSLRHRNSTSILSAELQAIFQCLEIILSLPLSHSRSFPICSDSLSSLSAIFNTSSTHPLVNRIHTLVLTLTSIPVRITFVWVPSHRGIRGNENIDAATKSAAHLPRIQPYILPTKSDHTLSIHHKISEFWTSHWQSQKSSNKLATLEPFPIPWTSTHQPHQRHEICFTRLRIGHTRLTHSHLLSHLFPHHVTSVAPTHPLPSSTFFLAHTSPHTAKHTKSPLSFSRP